MTPVVLDASAYLALLRKETGWENVKTYLDRSLHISTVNLCEVATILYRNQEIPDPGAIRENIEAMRLNVQPYSMHHSFIAANISTFVPKDISLGTVLKFATAPAKTPIFENRSAAYALYVSTGSAENGVCSKP